MCFLYVSAATTNLLSRYIHVHVVAWKVCSKSKHAHFRHLITQIHVDLTHTYIDRELNSMKKWCQLV